jgi:hypothetical protein
MTTFAQILAVVSALTAPPEATAQRADVPWDVGERLEYQVKFSAFSVGTGSMEVKGIVPVRGRDAWHTEFRVKGRAFWYDYASTLQSWIDVAQFASLRFHSDSDENGRDRVKKFEIYPDRDVYVEEPANGGEHVEQSSVDEPLDEGSFLYFVRTVPLEVGQTYSFTRYFRPDRNPVTIKVLRKERVKVPAGTFDAIVIQPIIKTRGIFSEGGQAQIWLRDDPSRIMLQMKSNLSIGSINLFLKSYRPGTGTTQ